LEAVHQAFPAVELHVFLELGERQLLAASPVRALHFAQGAMVVFVLLHIGPGHAFAAQAAHYHAPRALRSAVHLSGGGRRWWRNVKARKE